MAVRCGDCGEVTLVEGDFRVCPICRTRTRLAPERRVGRRTQFKGVNRCYECSVVIPHGKSHCSRCE